MDTTFHFELVTPDRLVVETDVASVIAPGVEGYLGVMPKHTYFISALKEGILTIRESSRIAKYNIGKGYIQVTPQKTIVVTESAEEQ
jgi:F-type H+-transporting ATPase subunit epsilon